MNYLVTGGAGFIGSHLVEELLNRGHRVTVIDNLATGRRDYVPQEAAFVEADIRDVHAIKPHFEGIDGVFHVAAWPRVPRSIKEPMITHDVNLSGTINVLQASVEGGVKKLIFSGSSTAYGDQDTLPLHEDMKPRPMCPYAAQKVAGELYCSIYSQLYNLETVCLRYFSVYGTNMLMDDEYAMAAPAFLKARMNNKPVTIYGDGTVTRDYTHVDDIVRGNILAMESALKNAEIINLGSGNNVSVNELAQAIGVEVQYAPARYEPKDTLADNARARELLGWEPTIPFKQGIEELTQFYLETYTLTQHSYETEREIA